MSILGDFSSGMIFGRVKSVTTDLAAHEAVTGSSAHGAVSAATANQIIVRDGNGRANVASPPASDNTTLIATTAWVQTELASVGGGTVTSVSQGTGMSFSVNPITTTGTINLANTTVTPGTYNFATITVDAQGRLTSASSGSPVTSVGATSPVTTTGGATPTIGMPAATASVNGYMTTAFASKLNGIEAGAEVNDVASVFGRTGAVVAASGDYDIQEIGGVTVSDSAPSGGSNGDLWFEF